MFSEVFNVVKNLTFLLYKANVLTAVCLSACNQHNTESCGGFPGHSTVSLNPGRFELGIGLG